jgi:putative transposase
MDGHVYHVMNRAAKRSRIFASAADYLAFECVLEETALVHHREVAVFAYCLMPNHWHLVAGPTAPGALSAFMHRLTTTHARRWHRARGSTGEGAVYQGRFTSIPIQCDRHFLIACRYVERNALRASLVSRAEDWPWCSLSRRLSEGTTWLSQWPIERPDSWLREINTPQTIDEMEGLREATRLGCPFGDEEWKERVWAKSPSDTRPQQESITNT